MAESAIKCFAYYMSTKCRFRSHIRLDVSTKSRFIDTFNSREAVELSVLSDVVIEYETKHYPIGKPTVAELIELSLEEKGMTQKQLATEIGVSPSRINDYVSGRAEPTLRVARLLCIALGILPSAMLGM